MTLCDASVLITLITPEAIGLTKKPGRIDQSVRVMKYTSLRGRSFTHAPSLKSNLP